jgi:hypothetical protein
MPIEIVKEERKSQSAKVSQHLGPHTVMAKVGGTDMKVILPVNAGVPKVGSELKLDVRNTRKGRPFKAYWIPD